MTFAEACQIAVSPVHLDRALRSAVEAYRHTRERSDYLALREAAERCGMPSGEPPLSWAEQRLGAASKAEPA